MKPLHTLDLTQPLQTIQNGPAHWSAENDFGDRIGFTNFYMEWNGKPLLLVAGEFHPSRTDAAFWEEAILKMKAGGLNTVSFYMIWNHIEQKPGQFDFSGNRDFRTFVKLCAKHGMYVWPRVGPYCNSEAFAGGLPAWLYGQPVRERSNDPGYLFYVGRLFREIGKQFDGLLFKDGGPIVSIQLENEYGHASGNWDAFYHYGAGLVNKGDGGESHLRLLRELAVDAGLIVPFYSCTAWGAAVAPEEDFLLTYAGYTYLGNNGPTPYSTFNIGPKTFDYPFATCELGGGAPAQRAWRPVIPPEGVEVSLFTRVACGCNMTGIYMYHGGTNPASYDRFYAMDGNLTLLSYDFHAPISEYGIRTSAYYQLRPLQQLLIEFGEALCRMVPVWQETYVAPENKDDLRFMARVHDGSGFLFLNNYQDKLNLPDRKDVAIELQLAEETIRIGGVSGFHIAGGAMAVLPFNMRLSGALLKYATAQPLFEIEHEDTSYWFFFAPKGMTPSYVFAPHSFGGISGAEAAETADGICVTPGRTGFDSAFSIDTAQGRVIIVTLDDRQAKRCVKAKIRGAERLLYSEADLVYEEASVKVSAIGDNELAFSIFPAPGESAVGPGGLVRGNKEGLLTTFAVRCEAIELQYDLVRCEDDGALLKVTDAQFQGLSDIFVKVDYQGDCARIFSDGLLIADHLNNGTPWLVGLKSFRQAAASRGLYIRLSPWMSDPGETIFDGTTFIKKDLKVGDPARFESIELIPEYRAVFSL